MIDLETARRRAAERYPESLPGKDGPYPNIPRRAILAGKWDDGSLVRDFLDKMGDVR